MSAAAQWPGRRTYAVGAAAAILFALYGSLVPFDWRAVSVADAVRQYAEFWTRIRVSWGTRSDLIANVLLAVPIGFFVMGSLTLDRFGFGARITRAAATLITGAVLALVFEFLQIFVENRVVSQRDVFAQTAGTLIGLTAWLVLGQTLTDFLRGHRARHAGLPAGLQRLRAILALYAAGWLVSMLQPFDLTLSPGEIWAKARDGGINLVPFGGSYTSWTDRAWDVISAAVSAVPLGGLALLMVVRLGARRRQVVALAAGVLFVSASELVQILVVNRVVDVTDVMTGSLGIWLGIVVTARYAALPARSSELAGPVAGGSLAMGRRTMAAVACSVAWFGVLAFYHWKPFAFDLTPAHVRERMQQMSLLPLRQYQFETGAQLLAQALLKGGLGIPLGLCLGFGTAGAWRETPYGETLRWTLALSMGVLVFGVIEAGQLFLPQRVPDITDVLWGTLGTAAGLRIAALVGAGGRGDVAAFASRNQ
jgi:glycopeptide antibiotics resistance protein